MRIGCARAQLGNVFVLNLLCTSERYAVNRSFCRSGKYARSCAGLSWPLYTTVRLDNELQKKSSIGSVGEAPLASLTLTSASRRRTYSFVSKSTSVLSMSLSRRGSLSSAQRGLTNNCATSGSVAFAESPRFAPSASVGTSRHPSTSIPSSAHAAFTAATHTAFAGVSSLGR